MKKLVFFTLILSSQIAFSAISLTISENGFIDFGSMDPGGSEYTGGVYDYKKSTTVTFSVTAGTPFTFGVKANEFMGPASLPLESMSWQLTYAGGNMSVSPWYRHLYQEGVSYEPNIVKPTGYFSSNEQYIYDSSVHGFPATDSGAYQYQFLWHINIPNNQQAGNYMTTIMFTLTQ